MGAATDRSKLWKYLRRLVLIAIVLAISFFLIIFAPYGASILHNLITLNNFAAPFLEYPLPPSTTEIDRELRWGPLSAGHLCGFRAIRVLSTELSHDDIEAYYRGVTFPVVVPERSTFDAIDGLDGETVVIVAFNEKTPGLAEVSIVDGIYGNTFWDIAC